MRNTVMSMSVYLSVSSHNSKTTQQNFTKFFMLVAHGRDIVAQSSSDRVAMFYVGLHPVLWM